MNPKPIVAAMVLLLVVGASACALEPEPLPSPPPTVLPTVQPEPTTPPVDVLDPSGCELHLWHAFAGLKEAALLNLVAKFEADNPYGIRLRVEYHSPLHQEVLTAISAGTPPDVVLAPCDQIAEYAALNAVAPLMPYVENAKYGLAEQADLWPIALSGCAGTQPRGSWGLSFDLQAAVMFYNASWLKKIKAEAPPQNWTDFRKLCNAARDKKAATWGYAYPAQNAGWSTDPAQNAGWSTDPAQNAGWSTDNADGLALINWISGLGGVLFDSDDGQVTLDDPQAVAALGVLGDLLEDGCAYCSSEPGADRADFAAEKVLFTFGSTTDLPKYTEAIYNTKTQKNKFAWDIVPIPYLASEPIIMVQGSVMSILHTTPRQQLAAWLFLKWFALRENDVQWALAAGALPLHKSSTETPEMQAYLEQNPQYKTACGLLAFAATEPAIPRWQDIRALLVNAAEAVCFGQAEPADVLAAADTATDGLLAR